MISVVFIGLHGPHPKWGMHDWYSIQLAAEMTYLEATKVPPHSCNPWKVNYSQYCKTWNLVIWHQIRLSYGHHNPQYSRNQYSGHWGLKIEKILPKRLLLRFLPIPPYIFFISLAIQGYFFLSLTGLPSTILPWGNPLRSSGFFFPSIPHLHSIKNVNDNNSNKVLGNYELQITYLAGQNSVVKKMLT